MSDRLASRGPLVAPCIRCGQCLADVPRGDPCPACGTPWTSPPIRFFWRAQVIGIVVIPIMLFVGLLWFATADDEARDAPGRFLALAFGLTLAHVIAGGIACFVVPRHHRPPGAGKLVIATLVMLLLLGILAPALGKC